MFTLNRMAFTAAPKPYWIGLLFTQQQWQIHTFSWRGGGGAVIQTLRQGGGGVILRKTFFGPLVLSLV